MSELADRLRIAFDRGDLTQASAARALGVSISGIKSWLSGRSEPRASDVVAIAVLTATSPSWLLTGNGPVDWSEWAQPEGPRFIDGRDPTDRELMGRCVDQLSKLYQELNIKLPMLDMGREAADLHDEVLASGASSVEEYLGALRVLIAQRRRALLTAPPTGKLQDSA